MKENFRFKKDQNNQVYPYKINKVMYKDFDFDSNTFAFG